jgi:hypothetical protein
MFEVFFNVLPIIEIINPDIGIKNRTNRVNLKLIRNIAIKVKKTVRGSLTINSSTDKNECCISKTSAVILDITSPFFFSEKKGIGKLIIFL